MKKLFLLLAVIFTFLSTNAQNKDDIKKYTSQKSQYCFIENKGQMHDQNYKANLDVKYLLCLGNGMNVQLKKNSFSYDTYKTVVKEKAKDKIGITDKMRPGFDSVKDIIYFFHRVDVELIGANPNPIIIAEDASSEYINYYNAVTPESGATNVSKFNKITYINIYPGIDMIFEAQAGKSKPVEYTFVVHPGADGKLIKLHYIGANETQLTDNRIIVDVAQGSFVESIPASWVKESNLKLNVTYKNIQKNIYGFEIPFYSNTQTLIIDPNPNLDWGTYYGGNDYDEGYGITCDGSGNAFITGRTFSTTSIATTGSHQTTLGGGCNAFVAKFNNSGVRQWCTYYGNNTSGSGITCDGSGNVFITGGADSSNSIATTGSHQTTYGGNGDAFIAKFNNNGVRQWGTYYGGNGLDNGKSITCDGSGNVFITGYTTSTTLIATIGSHQSTIGGMDDTFVVKFNNNGVRQWGTYYGGNYNDDIWGITCDGSGNIFISGTTTSPTSISTIGSHQATLGGMGDAFVVKFNNSGARQWGTYYGGNDFDEGYGITCDGSGNVYITGQTYSTILIASSGAHQTTIGGNSDAFIVKFNPYGVRQWGTYYGGNDYDYCDGITCDGSGNVFITGRTKSTTSIATTSSYQTIFGEGTADAFVVKFNNSGARQWGTYYGGNDYDEGYGITCDGSGNAFITGSTSSSTSIATTGSHQTTYGGSSFDAFVARFSTCEFPSNAGSIIGNTIVCKGQNAVIYTIPIIADATSYIWTLPNGATGTSTSNSIIVNFSSNATSGNITVKGRNICGNYGIASALSIVVNNLTADAGNNSNITCGDNILLSPTINYTGSQSNLSYQWSPAYGLNDINLEYPTANPTMSTTYYLNVSSIEGCSALDSIKLTLIPLAITASNITITCGNTFFINATINSNSSAISYVWSPTTGLYNPNILNTYGNTANTITYVLNAIDGGCTATKTVKVTVNPANYNPNFTVNQTLFTAPPFVVQYNNTTSNMSNYNFTWYFGDGTSLSSNNTSVFHTYNYNGLYSVSLIATHASNFCQDTILKPGYIYCTGGPNDINEQSINGRKVTIYPNPTYDNMNVQIPILLLGSNYTISDQLGRIILKGKLINENTTIQLSDLSAGIYLLKIADIEYQALKLIKN